MRVLIFSTAYLPFVGGAEVAVKELTDRLGSEIEFDLITARMKRGLPSFERVGKVDVYRIGIGVETLDKLLLPFLGALKALRLHKARGYARFWCVMASFASGAGYICNMLLGLSGRKKVPVILNLQEGDSESHLRFRWLGLIDLSWRLALRRTDFLTALSRYLLERAKRLGYKGEAFVIPNGVDVERFSSPGEAAHKDGETVLITTSRLVEKNGVRGVIEAMPHLSENVSLKIIGSGALEKRLKRRAQELKLGERVEFMGFVPQDEIPAELHKADIFIRPSLSEGQGISFIEAMTAGLPVVATPVGGIPDFLTDGETGVFCKPRDPQSIADAVSRIMGDPALAHRLKQNGRKLAQERYSWDLIAEDMKSKVFDVV